MKNSILVADLWPDCDGAVIVEFTVIMSTLFILTLGTVDLGNLLYDYDRASKAVFAGAHRAIVSDPVASGITTVSWNTGNLGQDCSNASTAGLCSGYAASSVCTASSRTSGLCTSGTFNSVAFDAVLDRMQTVYGCTAGSTTCALQASNVTIRYQVDGTLGFVGQPNGLPMRVTVSLKCMNHTFYFIGALMGWSFQPQQGCGGTAAGWAIPPYSTTLTSEDMVTN